VKRTPLTRRTRLARTPITKRGKRGRRFKLSEPNLPYRAWIRSFPCSVPDCGAWPIEAHHVTTRGAGGRDEGELIPLCKSHHDTWHTQGRLTFQRRYGINARTIATEVWARYTTEETRA
jgi:hypothetical protein